jgi:DNA repair exonuclease SbcCD ATPase subunit
MGTNELAAEAAVLWRPDRRGSPRAAELQGELEALREGRRQALARDAALRELHLREAEGSTRLAALRGRRTAVRERRDEAMRRETLRGEQEARVRSLREELERVRGQPNDAPGRAPGSGLLAFASGGVLAALSLADLLMGGGIGLRSVGGGLLGALLLALGTAGLARWRERSRAASRARQAQEEEIARLERSLEEVEAASPGPTGAGHAVDEAESLADDLAALDREIEELLQALERGRQEASYLEGRETPDLVEGRILAVEEELQEVRRRRDRIFLLSRLIRLAERRFREAHQPDLIRRAGRHLGRITGGRYAQFLLSDATDDDPLRLRGGDVERPLPISPPLSTGTREQAYLALRLAIVDHLDDGHEPLPLILDEVFANWDPPRRGRALDLLVAISASRQVFLLTCDPATAAAAAKRGGEVLSLEPHSPMEPDTR